MNQGRMLEFQQKKSSRGEKYDAGDDLSQL